MTERSGPVINRWTIALLLAAVLLPSLIFIALQFGFGYRAERRAYEISTLARADAIMSEIDGNMQRTRASALVLAEAASVKDDNWKRAYARAREVASLNYDWTSVRLVDVVASRELFDLRHPFGTPRNVARDPALLQEIGDNSLLFGGISQAGEGCPCLPVIVPIRRDGRIRFVMTILLNPYAFQKELVAHAPPDGTSAVVDANGNFIGRTRDYAARVGTPATHFVRDAIRQGKTGIYPRQNL